VIRHHRVSSQSNDGAVSAALWSTTDAQPVAHPDDIADRVGHDQACWQTNSGPTWQARRTNVMKPANEPVSISGRVCTIKDPRMANRLLVTLVVISVAGAIWLVAAMFAGPWLADSLLVEGTVAAATVLAAALMAWSLSRALGCGRCHTPQCRCT
jgi:hypothetical protein